MNPDPSIEAVIKDAIQRCGVNRDQVAIYEITPTIWPDTGLGAGQPGYAYAQVITPGNVIRLIAGNQQLTYHTDAQTDNFVFVEQSS